jgi:putative transposase
LGKGQTRWTGFDDKIVSMYARRMTTREIQCHLEEMYQVEVSPTLISHVTEAVMEESKDLAETGAERAVSHPVSGRADGEGAGRRPLQNKAIYGVLGVSLEGQKEVLGLWVAQNEGAKVWLQVLTELQNRGVKDIFIACVDGLKGFPEAIEAVYPRTEVQPCIVHLVRASLNYVPWKLRKQAAADLQLTYRAATAAEAEQQLAALESKWKTYPSLSQVWRRNWERIIPFFNYPPDIRRAIYTTNSVEALNRSLRKISKTRGGFPNQEAALKLLFWLCGRQPRSGPCPSITGGRRSTTSPFCGRNGGRAWRGLRNEPAQCLYKDGRGRRCLGVHPWGETRS